GRGRAARRGLAAGRAVGRARRGPDGGRPVARRDDGNGRLPRPAARRPDRRRGRVPRRVLRAVPSRARAHRAVGLVHGAAPHRVGGGARRRRARRPRGARRPRPVVPARPAPARGARPVVARRRVGALAARAAPAPPAHGPRVADPAPQLDGRATVGTVARPLALSPLTRCPPATPGGASCPRPPRGRAVRAAWRAPPRSAGPSRTRRTATARPG